MDGWIDGRMEADGLPDSSCFPQLHKKVLSLDMIYQKFPV